MSLKTFHIYFIFVSALLLVGLEMWELKAYLTGAPANLAVAAAAFVGTVLLLAYGTWFVRKFRDESYR